MLPILRIMFNKQGNMLSYLVDTFVRNIHTEVREISEVFQLRIIRTYTKPSGVVDLLNILLSINTV